jgi:hypothetical protein
MEMLPAIKPTREGIPYRVLFAMAAMSSNRASGESRSGMGIFLFNHVAIK